MTGTSIVKYLTTHEECVFLDGSRRVPTAKDKLRFMGKRLNAAWKALRLI